MSFREAFTSNRVATFIISFLGVIGTIITIYAFFFQQKKTELTYEIIANTNVLDIRAEVSKLDVLYDGTSLKHRNENLRIISVRVINSGTENILNSFYDDNAPLGLELSGGKIIENPEILEASNEYIKSNLRISLDSLVKVTFSKVILESKEYFVIKLLVLHPSNVSPAIKAVGKVAGIRTIRVLNVLQAKEEKPFFKQVFSGDIFVQVARALVYTLLVILLVIVLVVAGDKISKIRVKKHRRRLIQEFKELKDYVYNRMDDAIFDRFEKDGARLIEMMTNLLKDERDLNDRYRRLAERLKDVDKKDVVRFSSPPERDLIYYSLPGVREWNMIDEMIKDGVVIKENDGLVVNQAMKSTLDKLLAFLIQKGEINKQISRALRHGTLGLPSD